MTHSTADQYVLDVRELDEFKLERVPGSIHLPLSELDALAPGILKPLRECNLVIMCRGGNRARLAHAQLVTRGLLSTERSRVFEGGIMEWKRQGLATEGGGAAGTLPLMRQVQLAAGLLAAGGAAMALLVNPTWVYLSLAVGVGLSVAGLTGFCGMALLLQKMPWNRETPAKAPTCTPTGAASGAITSGAIK